MDAITALITFGAGLAGVGLGGFLARRNEKKSQGERLLVEALNDAITAIANVASGDPDAQARYASATARIALHAPPAVVTAFREFQDDATTVSPDGRARLLAAIQAAREELDHGNVSNDDLAVLLFGSNSPGAARPKARAR